MGGLYLFQPDNQTDKNSKQMIDGQIRLQDRQLN